MFSIDLDQKSDTHSPTNSNAKDLLNKLELSKNIITDNNLLPEEDRKLKKKDCYHKIPIKRIASYLKAARPECSIPIVSVGSGNGVLEYSLKNDYGIYNWFLVDPEPESFQLYPSNKPDFITVDDLVANREDVIGNCVLFLGWPDCVKSTKEYYTEDSYYDIDAVIMLKPISIIMIYETLGASGGSDMHHWLKTIDVEAQAYNDNTSHIAPCDSYRHMNHYTRCKKITSITYSSVINSLVWIKKTSDRTVSTLVDVDNRVSNSLLRNEKHSFKNTCLIT